MDNPKTVRIIQKLFGQSRNCPDNPKTVRTIHKLSGQSSNCPNNPKTVTICNNLVIFIGSTRICRKIVDVAIYALYPESFCENFAIRKVFAFSDSVGIMGHMLKYEKQPLFYCCHTHFLPFARNGLFWGFGHMCPNPLSSLSAIF